MELAKKNRRISHAVKALELLSANARTRALYEERVKAARDKRAELDYAKEEGWAEGKAEGQGEVLALVRQGLSAAEIEERLSRTPTP